MGLYLHETGPRSGKTILFLHGGGMEGSIFAPSMDLLKEYHCIAPDFPEHGKSKAEGPLRMDGLVAELESLIDSHAANQRLHLVGLALGGAAAINLAARMPDRIAGIIAAGTAARTGMFQVNQGILKAAYYEWIGFDRINRLKHQFFGHELEYEQLPSIGDEVVAEDDVRQMKLLRTRISLPVPASIPILVMAGIAETLSGKSKTREFADAVGGIGGLMPSAEAEPLYGQHGRFAELIRTWVEKGKTPGWLVPISE